MSQAPPCCPQVKANDRQTSLLQWLLGRCLASSSGHQVARLPSELAACCRAAAVLPGAVAKQLEELQEGLAGLQDQVHALQLQQQEAEGVAEAQAGRQTESGLDGSTRGAAGEATTPSASAAQQVVRASGEAVVAEREVCSLAQHYAALAQRHAQVVAHHGRCLEALRGLAAFFCEEYDCSDPTR